MTMNENPNRKHRETNKIPTGIASVLSQNSAPNPPPLPEELISEILSYLPVKSLLQFRSVSKLWLSLISNPQFTNTHLVKSTKNTQFTNHKLILSYKHPFDIKSCSVKSLFNDCDGDGGVVELEYPMKMPHNSVWVVGCCNGLVCLAIEDSLFLWNPSVRKSRRLRSPEIKIGFACYMIYGFGYDECGGDYKVVGIFCVFRNYGADETEVKVYSSRDDYWRRIEDFPFGLPLHSGKFANGALHWSACRDIRLGSSCSWLIVSLDLVNETYREIAQPGYEEGEYDLTLGVLRESLCVLCNYGKTRMDVWVMECGGGESWTKLVTVPYLSDPVSRMYSVPFGISEDGVVLLECMSQIILYNSNDSTIKNPVIHDVDGFLDAHTYVESLVSPI